MAAFLGQVSGRKICDDPLRRQGQAAAGEWAAHPLAAFGHRLVRQADDGEDGFAVLTDQLHLDVHAPDLLPIKGDRDNPCDNDPFP